MNIIWIGKKKIFAKIANIAQKSPVLVLDEGLEANTEIRKDNLTRLSTILELFLEQKFVEINGKDSYGPKEHQEWLISEREKYYSIFIQHVTNKKIVPDGLGLGNMSFGGWDSLKHRAGEANFSNNTQRNQSMLAAINKNAHPVTVVIAGFFHVPLGEHYFSAKRDKKFSFENPINYEGYYALAESARKEKQNRGTMSFYDEFLTGTEVLYRGLKDGQWNFIQAIPKSSLSLWESQTPKGK